MRHENQLKRRLATGEAVLGTWAILPHPAVTNVIAAAGFDFVIADLEHGPFSLSEVENLVRAAESEHRSALVRVPDNDRSWILRALETGAHGIVVPQIASATDAYCAVTAVKYHPGGGRGFSPYTRSGGYTHGRSIDIANRENRRTLTVLIVEGLEGLASLDAIAAVPGVDAIYIGIYDLSQSAGRPGEIDHPDVVAAAEGAVARIAKQGIAAGCLAQTPEQLQRYRELGVRFLVYQADCSLLFEACQSAVATFGETHAHAAHNTDHARRAQPARKVRHVHHAQHVRHARHAVDAQPAHHKDHGAAARKASGKVGPAHGKTRVPSGEARDPSDEGRVAVPAQPPAPVEANE